MYDQHFFPFCAYTTLFNPSNESRRNWNGVESLDSTKTWIHRLILVCMHLIIILERCWANYIYLLSSFFKKDLITLIQNSGLHWLMAWHCTINHCFLNPIRIYSGHLDPIRIYSGVFLVWRYTESPSCLEAQKPSATSNIHWQRITQLHDWNLVKKPRHQITPTL